MSNRVAIEAQDLHSRFGYQALIEAESLLEAATAAMDHQAGIFYADVCKALLSTLSYRRFAISEADGGAVVRVPQFLRCGF